MLLSLPKLLFGFRAGQSSQEGALIISQPQVENQQLTFIV
jgi:hypothetical protein